MDRKDLVGDLINFRGIVYAPLNEQGVVFLFGKVIEDLNMYIELIGVLLNRMLIMVIITGPYSYFPYTAGSILYFSMRGNISASLFI